MESLKNRTLEAWGSIPHSSTKRLRFIFPGGPRGTVGERCFGVLAALFIAACAPEPMPCEGGLTVRLEPNGAVNVAEVSRRAAAYWTAMGCPVEVAEDAEILVRWDIDVLLKHGFAGITVDHHDVAIAPRDYYDGSDCATAGIATILAHELGHVFGFAHSPRPEAMMWAGLRDFCEDKTRELAPIL